MRTRSVVVVTAVTEEIAAEPDYLDVDVVDEDSGALPVGGGAARAASVQPTLFDETVVPVVAEAPVEVAAPVAVDTDEEETIAEGDATDQFEAIAEPTSRDISRPAIRTALPTSTNTSRTLRVWRPRRSRRRP